MNLTKALDQAIARENRRVVAGLCPHCLGTKVLYLPRAGGGHKRVPCQRCEVTGRR